MPTIPLPRACGSLSSFLQLLPHPPFTPSQPFFSPFSFLSPSLDFPPLFPSSSTLSSPLSLLPKGNLCPSQQPLSFEESPGGDGSDLRGQASVAQG